MEFDIESLPGVSSFGAVVTGLSPDRLDRPEIRRALNALWIEKGVIVFRGITGKPAHIRLSEVFGEVQEHPLWRGIEGMPREDKLLIDLEFDEKTGQGDLYEVAGEVRGGWLPWHFDGTYSDQINRGGIMCPIELPPQGGQTGFIDKIAVYDSLPENLKARIAGLNVIYVYNLDASQARFGIRPDRTVCLSEKVRMLSAKVTRRSIHPMVFKQPGTGRDMLNVSPWFADGIEGMETEAGDALLREVVEYCIRDELAYFHEWRIGDMLLWDNWRMLHCASGVPAGIRRHMRRTTIMGDYCLGRYETVAEPGIAVPSM